MVIARLRHSLSLKQSRQQKDPSPPLETEESILLRVLVQALVIVGIVATDTAAQTQTSLWAVPLSIIGATWSWQKRKKRNIAVKFLLAFGMLAAMMAFFGNVFANLNDTRVVLAQLLIQLQVLHSFDLPRRKDLGYSMVIGLILLGVAGTVSQTLTFAPFLLCFLAIAIPVLVLDYRSRLGIETEWRSKRSDWRELLPLSPRRFGLLLSLVLALGLIIFALMPRFPGYQLQTFPVSSPVELEDRNFASQERGVVNPGYVKEGETDGAEGRGKANVRGPGEVDSDFYYGFNSKINQNLRGQLQKQVVMRVRSQSPGFWRVLMFDRYTGQGWEIGRDKETTNLSRPNWSYRFYVSAPPTLAPTKTTVQSYTVVSELPNLIPALAYPKYLFFPTQEVALDPEGSLRSPVSLVKGLTYTVISEVPERDRTKLRKVKEIYPKSITNYYLQIPDAIAQRVRQQTLALLSKSPQPLVSAYDKTLFLAQALKQNYTLQPDVPFYRQDEDLVEAFLFRDRGGYPDHFSTALTLMLRSIGIPARLAVGFAPGQFNPFTGFYIVHNTDAYALSEVFFPGYGWFAFDPIPGHEVIPPSFEDSQTFSVLRQFWNWVALWLPSPVTSWWNEFIGKLSGIFIAIWSFISTSSIGLLAGLMGAVALGFLGFLGWKQSQSWNYRRRLAKLHPMERLYRQMLEVLKSEGYFMHPSQTPLEYLAFLRRDALDVPIEIIEEISRAYMSWRYGERVPDIEYLQQRLRKLKRDWKKPRVQKGLKKSFSHFKTTNHS